VTHSRENDPEVGLLRMLRESLRAGLAAGADHEAWAMARSAAQIIGLKGLEAALEALEPHRGHAWSGAARELVEFVERLASEQDLSAFRVAGPDLMARAEALREWRAAAAPVAEAALEAEIEPPAGTLTVAEALADLPLSGDSGSERASRARLLPQVATSLRAALEWLAGELDPPRAFRLRAEDSVLEVVCEGVQPEGIAAAHDVLAAAGGSLSPLGEISARAVAGVWIVRAPAWSPRPVHLMLQQGELRLAVPWHAVLRLSLVPTIEIEMRGGTLATPVLAPLVPLAEGIGERPVVAIAHGIKRALLVADQLVWRLGAEACEPPGPPPAPGLSRTVCSDDGEAFWVAEPAMLLAEVPLPSLPSPGSGRKRAPEAEPQAATAAPEAKPPVAMPEIEVPVGAPVIEVPVAMPEIEAPVAPPEIEAPVELSADDVEPIELTAAEVEPLAVAEAREPAEVLAAAAPVAAVTELAAVPAPPVAAPEPETPILPDWLERFGTTGGPARSAPTAGSSSLPRPGAPLVLIAEDSIAARHFLARLFERRGFAVRAVESAAALRAALPERHWNLVCADVELPDGRGPALLGELRAELERLDVPLVALVRDDEDAGIAADSGVRRWLRKPFDSEELDHLLSRLGMLEGERT